MNPKLIVHGGAWSIPEEYEQDHIQGVQDAVAMVYPNLLDGIHALDAVEKAVRIMEENPTFDAGKGAFLNAIGEIELDAMIMNGKTFDFGAVVAVQNILHPISLARRVMEKSEHCMLAGNGAQQFARQMGISKVETGELLTTREYKFYQQIKNDPNFKTKHPFEPFPKGTVGAVALDRHGNLAAATSTGGTPRKTPGRVADSAIIGAGTYANNELGAASSTGWGEAIMKILLSKTVCDFLSNLSAIQAAEKAIDVLEKRVQGWGGVILIDKNGNYGFAFNTSKMAFAYVDDSGKIVSKIKLN